MWAGHAPSFSNHRSRSVPPTSPTFHNHSDGTTSSAIPSTIPASSTSTSTATRFRTHGPVGDLSPAQALHRFEQTCKRLRWKMIDLFHSLERASSPETWGFDPEDAEANFKVDFHESYVWIEQALVFLQLVFGVVIARGGGSSGGATHAYHHNVLQALADAKSPLYAPLGKGVVKEALWKAKELRNRWKPVGQEEEGKEAPPWKMYDVRWIVTTIMGGLEEAWVLARDRAGSDGREGFEEGEKEEGWSWMMEDGDTEMMDV